MTTSAAPLTRDDVREVVREEIDILRDEMREYYATKADLSDLKSDINARLIQVVIGLAGLQLIGIGAIAAILRLWGAS